MSNLESPFGGKGDEINSALLLRNLETFESFESFFN